MTVVKKVPWQEKWRSIDPVMENIMNNFQYIKLYGHLIGIAALDMFYYHDLNKILSIIHLQGVQKKEDLEFSTL